MGGFPEKKSTEWDLFFRPLNFEILNKWSTRTQLTVLLGAHEARRPVGLAGDLPSGSPFP